MTTIHADITCKSEYQHLWCYIELNTVFPTLLITKVRLKNESIYFMWIDPFLSLLNTIFLNLYDHLIAHACCPLGWTEIQIIN